VAERLSRKLLKRSLIKNWKTGGRGFNPLLGLISMELNPVEV